MTAEIITAAEMNSNIRDPGNFFLSWPVGEYRQTVAQSYSNSVGANLLFDTNDIDTDSMHSTSTNTDRVVPKTAGRFQLSGGGSWAGATNGFRDFELGKNGASINGGGTLMFTGSAAASLRMTTRTITQFANGSSDYFHIVGLQSSGGALLTAVSGTEQPTFSVRMVGTT